MQYSVAGRNFYCESRLAKNTLPRVVFDRGCTIFCQVYHSLLLLTAFLDSECYVTADHSNFQSRHALKARKLTKNYGIRAAKKVALSSMACSQPRTHKSTNLMADLKDCET